MPIAHKVYGCKFKCGFRHSRSPRRIEAHEARCWYNPESHTCKTCRFEEYYADSAGEFFSGGWQREPDYYVRDCKHPNAKDHDPISPIYDRLFPNGETGYGVQIPPVIECDWWEPPEDQRLRAEGHPELPGME